ncbi:MAG: porin family protein [Bacteroidales bacterium]
MKRNLLVLIFACFTLFSFAQTSFNVKAGLNLSSYMGSDAEGAKIKPGVRVGLGLEHQFTPLFSIQPSLFLSQKGSRASEDFVFDDIMLKGDVTVDEIYLELPVNAQLKFKVDKKTNFIIATGPYIACGVGGKTTVKLSSGYDKAKDKLDTFSDSGMDYRRFDIGWNIGFGFDFNKFLVGLDTQLGFTDLVEYASMRNVNVGVYVGYKF